MEMKPEDLKVGMVFAWRLNNEQISFFKKFICFYKDKVFLENIKFMHECDKIIVSEPELESPQWFFHNFKLIDKVPPKIVEVEEEVPLFVSSDYLKLLQEGTYSSIQAYIISGNVLDENPVQLCKIKRTVKKELNWCWESGQWI